jgi:hypothetical protein
VGKPEEKCTLGRYRLKWEGNIKMDIRKIGLGGRDWIALARYTNQWRVLINKVMNLRFS